MTATRCPRCKVAVGQGDIRAGAVTYVASRPTKYDDDGEPLRWGRRDRRAKVCGACVAELRKRPYTVA